MQTKHSSLAAVIVYRSNHGIHSQDVLMHGSLSRARATRESRSDNMNQKLFSISHIIGSAILLKEQLHWKCMLDRPWQADCCYATFLTLVGQSLFPCCKK